MCIRDRPNLPKVTRVSKTGLAEVATALWNADGCPANVYTPTTLLPRLRTIMASAMSEGFFADAVVLVEGEDDRAALLGTATHLGYDFDRVGLSIVTCGGKTCLDRPFVVFTNLG